MIENYGTTRTVLGLIFIALVFGGIILSWCSEGMITYRKPTILEKPKTKPQTKPTNNFRPDMDLTYAFSYMKTPILTQRELKQYYILKEITDQKNLLICPKVRLLDLVVPKPGFRNTNGLKARVMSKHVDFVICHPNMEVVAIIELDDSTHLRPDRKKRDNFVDGVLFGAGYHVIHTWAITSDILDFLN